VELPCELISSYVDAPLLYWATDLSPFGIWLETPLPMQLGEQVVVCFEPPVWWTGREITVFAEVARVTHGRQRAARRGEPQQLSGMGLEFLDLSTHERRALTAWLRGRPPPLPIRRQRQVQSMRSLPPPNCVAA